VFEIRPLDRPHLNRENGADAQRLVPWTLLNAPFEGSWCVIPVGGATGEHGHHEYEIMIAMTGRAEVACDGERRSFAAGDIVHFPPNTDHAILNVGDEPFQMYCVWWDTDMSEVFLGRHAAEAQVAVR
jgi:mannose-6-phosphate isomerase-like protein (cupin superfamily)